MSLQQDVEADQSGRHAPSPSDLEDDWHVVFQQRAVVEAKPVPKGSANAIANILNERAHGIAPESRETTSFGVSVPKSDDTPDDDDDDMHLHAALAESRRTKREVNPPPRRQLGKPTGTPQRQNVMTSPAKPGGFSGPLPFEKLDLGTSLLGKKKMQQRTEEAEGGFEKTDLAARQAKSADPIPPWFNGDIEKDIRKQERLEKADREKARAFGKQFQFQGRDEPLLRRQETEEVIDLDDGEGKAPVCEKKVVGQSEVIKLDDEEGKDGRVPVAPELTGVPVDDEIRMDDMADVVRAEPPVSDKMDYRDGGSRGPPTPSKRPAPFELVEGKQASLRTEYTRPAPFEMDSDDDEDSVEPAKEDDDEVLEWRESEDGKAVVPAEKAMRADTQPTGSERVPEKALKSPSIVFEDVPDKHASPVDKGKRHATKSPSPDAAMLDRPLSPFGSPPGLPDDDDEDSSPRPATCVTDQETISDEDDYGDFSDAEEEEMLRALTLEAESTPASPAPSTRSPQHKISKNTKKNSNNFVTSKRKTAEMQTR
ncbi:DNA repair protein rad2 [Friedmanniomyces endolithicus]|nr:DNA repair protein rad2 [Friedmanniomyces endolithicus]